MRKVTFIVRGRLSCWLYLPKRKTSVISLSDMVMPASKLTCFISDFKFSDLFSAMPSKSRLALSCCLVICTSIMLSSSALSRFSFHLM